MRRILTIVLGLLLIVVLAAAGLFLAVPDSFLKSRLEAMASDALGRELEIGDFTLRRWPPLAVEARDIRLADADWTGEGEMARIARLEMDVDGWGLLSGRLVVRRFVLERPDIVLVRGADGRVNWRFGGAGAGAEGAPSTAGRNGDADGGAEGLPEIREVRILDGRLRYLDRAAGTERSLDDITLTAVEDPLARRLSIEGGLDLDGAPLRLSGELGSPRALATGGRGELRARLELPEGALTFAGTVDGRTPEIAGNLDIAVSDLRGTLDRFGLAPETAEGTLRALALTAVLNASPRAAALQELKLSLDDITAAGRLGVVGLDSRPRLSAELRFGPLALDPYLPPAAEAGKGGEEEAAPETAAQAEGWPADPIVLPLPLPLDADLDLAFESLAARGVELGKGRVRARLEGASAGLEVVELAAYGGEATLELDLTAGTPHELRLAGRARGLEMRPLLAATAGFEKLEGQGELDLDLRTRGSSVRDMVAALGGQGRVTMRDGAIVGVNIAAMVRQVMTLGKEGGNAPARTDFAELGGSFTVTDGIVENRDLLLRAPLLRLDGEGTVNLPERTLDYRIRPALAATLEGQGASREPVLKAGVPIVLTGPWDAIEWRFDIGGTLTEAIADPARIGELVGKLKADPAILGKLGVDLGEAVGGKVGGAVEGVGGLVGGVLGGGEPSGSPAGSGEGAPATPLAPARKLFEGLLGR
ncbi:MAG TPA: AsmA family protein [Rhodospirillales bacterium]|nr:AsmA family protein [Rhodospirillales bacterium]